jgi:MFS family permease
VPESDRGRPAKGRARTAVQALRIRSYRWWFLAQVLSSSGNMTAAVAQSWLVLRLTHSAFLLALTATFSFTPSLVGGAWAGSVVDRFDRRRVLLVTQSSFFLLSAGLGALVALRAAPVWAVFAFAAVTGVVNAMDAPARQVFVLDLVGRDRAANAVGLNEVVINASRVLGPSVGGALLATVGVAACFFVNALSFVPPLVVVAALVARRGWQPVARQGRARPSGHVREGLSYAWKHPAVRSCILTAVAGGMLFNMGNTLPLMATRAFHGGPQAFGAMMAAFGGGALFGALMAGSGAEAPSGRLVRSLVAATGLEVCLTALSPAMWVLYAGLALAGFLSIWFIALANALVQLRTEPDLRGRVMGAWTMALPGMLPLTSLLVGAVATWGGGGAGAREGFGLAGVALLAAAAAGWRALGEPSTGTVAVREVPVAQAPAA